MSHPCGLKKIFLCLQEWGTTYFTFEEDPEPFGRVRDLIIVAMCKEMGINVMHEHSHTLYNLEVRYGTVLGTPVPVRYFLSHLGTVPDKTLKLMRIQAPHFPFVSFH
jgi:hypothetical protein